MGKFLETKHSDVGQKILKKPGKSTEQCKRESFYVKHPLHTIKRKLQKIAKKNGPPAKKLKTTHVQTLSENIPKPKPFENSLLSSDNIEVFENRSTHEYLLRLSGENNDDIFLVDEKQSYYKNYMFDNIVFQIFTEISLEGLDGITLEAFWKRLQWSLKISIEPAKQHIWHLIRANPKVKFYILPIERPELVVYDRYNSVDNTGVLIDTVSSPQDIYKIAIIDKAMDRGSCATYYEREEIVLVRDMSLSEVETQYGNKLVVVADQELRTNILYDETSDPNFKLENMEYCILERIGRAREFGEITQGNNSIALSFNHDSRTMFHYLKHMTGNNLICRQLFMVKCKISEQNKTGRLLHLPKFYHFRKNKYMILVEEIVNMLRKMPQLRADVKEVREKYPKYLMEKLPKSPEFKRYIDIDKVVPYRELYPNAGKKEYSCKSNAKEKSVRLLTLKDPHANICWHDMDKDSSDEEEETIPLGRRSFNVDPVREVYQYIISRAEEGCSQAEIIKNFDIDVPAVRLILRKLKKANAVIETKEDRGKQRVNKYVVKDRVFDFTSFEEPNKNYSVLEQFKEKQRKIIASTSRNVYDTDNYLLDKANIDFDNCMSTITFDLTTEICCDFLIREILTLNKIFDNLCDIKPKKLGKKLKFPLELSSRRIVDQDFALNKALREIGTYETNYIGFKNIPDEILGNKHKYDLFVKLFLLKALFGEIKINSEEILNVLGKKEKKSRKRKLEEFPPLVPDVLINDPTRKEKDKLNYMGNEPVTMLKFNDIVDGLRIDIVMSTIPENYIDSPVYLGDDQQLTERLLGRLNMILEVVYDEPKVFEDFNKLLRHISQKEADRGYNRKIDRKSLSRLLQKLTSEGYIKIYKVILYNERITKSQMFACHPSSSHNHPVIQNSVEQLKWKYVVGNSKERVSKPVINNKTIKSPFDARDILESISEMKQLTTVEMIQKSYNKSAGKVYGYRPKFIRMRIMHEILFYLVYGYNNNRKELTQDEVKELFANYSISLTEEDLEKMPPIYWKEISWKMFIPPMPKHTDWNEGWALVCDIILRLPLSVLAKVHNIPFCLRELEEILEHPVKRYYLMKNQSEVVRAAVLHRRKYLFDIHELLCRLAHCGLLQFGPEKYKEKDQTFIYLNKRASLLDTMTSDPGYNMISQKEYKQIRFYFSTQEDIHSYWYNVYNISMNTKLNQRNVVSGQTITLIDVSAKPELVRALSAKTQAEALEYDNGELLGDRRGACGLDSSLWVHIVKNWFWAHKANLPASSVVGLNQDCYQKENNEIPVSFNMLKKPVQPAHNKVYIVKKSKEPLKYAESVKSRVPPLKTSKNVQKISRKVTIRPKTKNREYYDTIDQAIIKRIGFKTKVRWSEAENKTLHLMRAACMFLSAKNFKKQNVFYTVLRDVLHRILPNVSKNKTSRAVQRRLHQMYVKNKDTLYLENNVSNLFKDNRIFKYFAPYIKELSSVAEGSKEKENKLTIAFVILMSYFRTHMSEIEKLLSGNRITVDHFSEENIKYSELHLKEVEEEEGIKKVKQKDAQNLSDIRKNVLKSVIHSSLSLKSDHSGIAFQLFKIYQRFSDNTIRDTINEMREQQLISAKKGSYKAFKDRGKLHMPFQLSNYYVYSQVTTFSIQTALEAYETFQMIRKRERKIISNVEELDKQRYGQMLAINEVSTFWYENITYKFHLPENAVILNPEIEDHSEVIDELAKRYLLRLQKDAKNASEEEQEVEANVEEENYEPQQPLDLSISSTSNDKTIDNLKTWVTSCIDGGRERSPSPEFIIQKATVKKSKEKKGDIKPNKFEDRPLPTLEEIKEGIMDRSASSEERTIPYITDLMDLLSENNEYILEDPNTEHLKSHFTTQFPYLEDIELSNLEEFDKSFVAEIIDAKLNTQEVWESVRKHIPSDKPRPVTEIEEMVSVLNGSQKDVLVAQSIVDFVESKKTLGATGPEIKKKFIQMEDSCTLEVIMSLLVESNILLRTGVCTITFVHYNYQSVWLVDTFSLSSDEEKQFKNRSNLKQIKEGIDKRLENAMFKVKLFPWTKVDGSLNENIFKIWLCNVLSRCMEYPNIMMNSLCEKFYYINPVDIFSLLEVLKHLGCIEIYTISNNETEIFKDWQTPTFYEASCLDEFSKMYIECNQFSMTCLGSFLAQGDECPESETTIKVE